MRLKAMRQWHDWVHQTWSQDQEPRAEDQHYVGCLKSVVNIPNTEERRVPPRFDDGAGPSYQTPKDLPYGMSFDWWTADAFQGKKENRVGK